MGDNNDRGRPGEKAAPRSNSNAPSIPTAEPPGYAEYAVVFDAETYVQMELLAIAALRALSTTQLRSLRWIGMLDEGWSRMYTELDERAERGET